MALAYRLGDPYMDPWSNPKSSAAPEPSATATASKPLQGPVADMFVQADARFHTLETAVAQLRETQAASQQANDAKAQQLQEQLAHHMMETKQVFTLCFRSGVS